EGVERAIGVKQTWLQRLVDRPNAGEREVKRALGQRPEVDIPSRERERPGIFELLGAPDLGQTIGLRTGSLAIARDRRVHIEKRAIGIEYKDGHQRAPEAAPRWPPAMTITAAGSSAGWRSRVRGCRRRGHRPRLRARSRPAPAR